jgi:hypothetical protein
VRERREKVVAENSKKITEVLNKREQVVVKAASTNTFSELLSLQGA